MINWTLQELVGVGGGGGGGGLLSVSTQLFIITSTRVLETSFNFA